MKARLLIAATLLVAAGAASAALNAYRTGISLQQGVRLGDGTVLPAGEYEVEINYKGYGNAAELLFSQKGNLLGRCPAEARGFLATANQVSEVHVRAWDPAQSKQIVGSSKSGAQPATTAPMGAPAAFSWEKSGFRAGQKGVAAPGSPGMLKLSFDSSHSSAGIIAVLPYVEKGTK